MMIRLVALCLLVNLHTHEYHPKGLATTARLPQRKCPPSLVRRAVAKETHVRIDNLCTYIQGLLHCINHDTVCYLSTSIDGVGIHRSPRGLLPALQIRMLPETRS